MKFTSFLLVTASMACLANAASLSKRDDSQAKIIHECIEGIKKTGSSAVSLNKDFSEIIKGKHDFATKFEKSAKEAIADIESFRPSCLKVSDTYTDAQIAELLQGFQPLIQSVDAFYTNILDHQKEASSQKKLIRDLVQHVNLSIGDFMAWKKKDGSTSLAEKVDGSLLKTADLIDKIKKTYGL